LAFNRLLLRRSLRSLQNNAHKKPFLRRPASGSRGADPFALEDLCQLYGSLGAATFVISRRTISHLSSRTPGLVRTPAAHLKQKLSNEA